MKFPYFGIGISIVSVRNNGFINFDTLGNTMKAIDTNEIDPKEMLPGIFRRTMVYNDDAMLCHFDMKKGSKIPLHDHPAAQLGYMISGKAEFYYETEDNKTIVTPGMSYMIPGGVPHGAKMLEDSLIIECFTPSRPEYAD
jgi:quercetin dioxygenase-like cupin family protein